MSRTRTGEIYDAAILEDARAKRERAEVIFRAIALAALILCAATACTIALGFVGLQIIPMTLIALLSATVIAGQFALSYRKKAQDRVNELVNF